MLHDGQPKVLEIDARLPSQTPTAVYWSSGLNIVELLQRTFREARLPAVDRTAPGACVFQHVRAQDGRLAVRGEHVMGGARPLALVPGFFGAHEALTDYQPGRGSWSATLITLGATRGEARARGRRSGRRRWSRRRTLTFNLKVRVDRVAARRRGGSAHDATDRGRRPRPDGASRGVRARPRRGLRPHAARAGPADGRSRPGARSTVAAPATTGGGSAAAPPPEALPPASPTFPRRAPSPSTGRASPPFR